MPCSTGYEPGLTPGLLDAPYWLLSRKRSNLTLPDAVRLKVCAAIARRGVTLVHNVTPLHSRDSSFLDDLSYSKEFK